MLLECNCCFCTSGESSTIVTDFGARVEELILKSSYSGKLRNVLLTHNNNATAIIENSWWKGMILLPWANRIGKVRINELLFFRICMSHWKLGDHVRIIIYITDPFQGQYTFFNEAFQLNVNENTTDPTHVNALHGLLAGKVFQVAKADATDESAILGVVYSFPGDEKGYPFKLTVMIEYTLDKNGFKLGFTVANDMATTPLPFYVGWHPYFACEAYKAYVTLDPCGKWSRVEMNENFNPTGITDIFKGLDGTTPIGGTSAKPTFYDDEYKVLTSPNDCARMETKLYDPDSNQTVVLWQDSNFRFVHVFTGSASLFQENAIAIEPMGGMADAYNNHDHLSVVSGDEVWKGEFGVYVT